MMKNTEYSPETKAAIILEVFQNKESMKDIACKHQVNYQTLQKWKKQVITHLPDLLGKKSDMVLLLERMQKINSSLKKQLVKKRHELDFLKRKRFVVLQLLKKEKN